LVVSTSAIERLVPEMTCYVSSGTLNSTHSLTNPTLHPCYHIHPSNSLSLFVDPVLIALIIFCHTAVAIVIGPPLQDLFGLNCGRLGLSARIR